MEIPGTQNSQTNLKKQNTTKQNRQTFRGLSA